MRELIRVNSLEEALGKKGAYLAGGTEILRLDSPLDKAISVIDILPFLSKEVEDEGDWIRIGAGCTFSSLLSSALIPSSSLFFSKNHQHLVISFQLLHP